MSWYICPSSSRRSCKSAEVHFLLESKLKWDNDSRGNRDRRSMRGIEKEKDRVLASQVQRRKLRQWVLPSVPATVGVWGKLLDTRWHRQKQRDWHRFSLVYFLPLLLHFQYSSHGEVLKMIFISSRCRTVSDKMPFEIRARVICDSGNTDIVYFYQEFIIRPESIARSVWVKG